MRNLIARIRTSILARDREEVRSWGTCGAALSPKSSPSTSVAPEPEVEGWIRIGAFALTGLMAVFLLWASLAPIDSAALTSGVVKVETSRKVVQSLEGGLLREILVREGQSVGEGEVLFRLDSVDAEADRDLLQGQLDVLLARAWRLEAQRSASGELSDPPSHALQRPRFRDAAQAQKRIFEEQRDSLDRQIDVWSRRKDQFMAQAEASRKRLASLAAQLPSLEEEATDARDLLEKGFGLKPRVLALLRQVQAQKGEVATETGKLSSLLEQMAEVEAQVSAINSADAKQVAEEIQEVQSKMAEAGDALIKSDARRGRRDVAAPVNGVVMNIRSFTAGGVIAPGGSLVDVVPAEEKLIIEARLLPTDIGVVHPDLEAIVRFVSYNQRTTPSLKGKVVRVSGDSQIDGRTGASFYSTTVEVPPHELARAPNLKLRPGMPVDIAIPTGSRTLLAYLTQPLADSISRSFRED